MKNQYFLSIQLDSNNQFINGIITVFEQDTPEELKRIVEPKLINALREHYKCPVKTVSIDCLILSTTILLSAYVLVEHEDSDFYETIKLKETTLY